MRFYQFIYLIIIMVMAQPGLAGIRYILLQSLEKAACTSDLQVQNLDIMSRGLFRAITEPNHRATRKILEDGANPNAVVIKAVEKLETKSQKVLNGINPDTFTDVQTLIYKEDVKDGEVARAIRSDSELVGATALHIAVMAGNAHIVNLLLESKGIRTDIKNRSGLTAFYLLVYQYHITDAHRKLMVESFIDKVEEEDINNVFTRAINAKNYPVMEAIAEHAPGSEAVQKLKDSRVNVFENIVHMVNGSTLQTTGFQERENYRSAFRHLSSQGLL